MPLWLSLAPALFVLAVGPVLWLGRTWAEDPASALPFVLLLALAVRSFASPGPAAPKRDRILAAALLGATAMARLAGEILAIRTVGALALVADVAAIALALGLRHRVRAASPFGLATLFALSLPITRVIERGFGFPLQMVSAQLAAGVLGLVRDDLVLEGTAIRAGAASLSVDLPCSGAAGLVHLAILWAVLVAGRHLAGRRVAIGLVSVIGGALASNALRLVMIAEAMLGGHDAMREPLHSVIGLVALAGGALPLVLLARKPSPTAPAMPARASLLPVRLGLPLGVAALFIALAVAHAPASPIDVARAPAAIVLPHVIGDVVGEGVPLTAQETAYFTQWGGTAAKRRYGPHDVTVVRTEAPLRHLHTPSECLAGAGYAVALLGVRAGSDPAAVYAVTAPDGTALTVTVRYFASDGARATSPAEAAWHWLNAPRTTWTMVSRATPVSLTGTGLEGDGVDRALARALDLSPAPRKTGETHAPIASLPTDFGHARAGLR